MYSKVEKSPEFIPEDKIHYHLIKALNLAFFHHNYYESIDYFKNHLYLLDQTTPSWLNFNYYHSLSMRYWQIGALTEAIKCREKALDISRKLDNEYSSVEALNGIAIYCISAGKFEKSKSCFENALFICQKRTEERFHVYKAMILSNMAETFDYFGYDVSKALNLFNDAEKITLNLSNSKRRLIQELLANIYFCKFDIFLLNSDLNSAMSYLDKLNKLIDENKDTFITFKFKLAKAKILIKKGRFKDKATAIDLLKQIFDSDELIADVSFVALVNLTALLILEYSETENDEILNEINVNITKTKKVEDFYVKYEILLLEVKLFLIKGEIQEAIRLLSKIIQECEKSGITGIKQKAENELTRIQKEQLKWISSTNDPLTLSKKIQMADFNSYFEDVLKQNIADDQIRKKFKNLQIQYE